MVTRLALSPTMEPDNDSARGVRDHELSLEADRRSRADAGGIRVEDTEPYLALQYIARMLKVLAVIVLLALVAEIVAGLAMEGTSALVPVLAQGVQSLLMAAGLWGAADLTRVLIDVGHDIRGERILLGRLAARGRFAVKRERKNGID